MLLFSVLFLITDDLDVLREECASLQRMHYAASSSRTRSAQINVYLGFCEKFDLMPTPCPPSQVALYITYMARRLSASSIRNYVSGLSYFLKCEGSPAVDYQDFTVIRAMAGASRKLGEAVRQAAPLLPAQLKVMLGFLSDAPVHVLFKAAILTSFRALLRKQNVTDSDATLKRRDFQFFKWGMIISVGKSKTIQKGERKVLIPVTYTPDESLCAVRWTQRHFEQVPMSQEGPAFAYPSTPSKALPYHTHQAAIKWLAGLAGMDPDWFSSHSLRRGGTTFLWLAGASIEEIKARGDWSSDTYMTYLSTPMEERIRRDLQVATTISAV